MHVVEPSAAKLAKQSRRSRAPLRLQATASKNTEQLFNDFSDEIKLPRKPKVQVMEEIPCWEVFGANMIIENQITKADQG